MFFLCNYLPTVGKYLNPIYKVCKSTMELLISKVIAKSSEDHCLPFWSREKRVGSHSTGKKGKQDGIVILKILFLSYIY